jgi:hypothetical protein
VGGASISIEDLVSDSLDTTSYIASLAHPPSVLSNSYGWNEQDASDADNRRVCAGLMAVAARGLTFLDASGDGGVRGDHDQASQCSNNTFVPPFPSTCPYGTPLRCTITAAGLMASSDVRGWHRRPAPRTRDELFHRRIFQHLPSPSIPRWRRARVLVDPARGLCRRVQPLRPRHSGRKPWRRVRQAPITDCLTSGSSPHKRRTSRSSSMVA